MSLRVCFFAFLLCATAVSGPPDLPNGKHVYRVHLTRMRAQAPIENAAPKIVSDEIKGAPQSAEKALQSGPRADKADLMLEIIAMPHTYPARSLARLEPTLASISATTPVAIAVPKFDPHKRLLEHLNLMQSTLNGKKSPLPQRICDQLNMYPRDTFITEFMKKSLLKDKRLESFPGIKKETFELLKNFADILPARLKYLMCYLLIRSQSAKIKFFDHAKAKGAPIINLGAVDELELERTSDHFTWIEWGLDALYNFDPDAPDSPQQCARVNSLQNDRISALRGVAPVARAECEIVTNAIKARGIQKNPPKRVERILQDKETHFNHVLKFEQGWFPFRIDRKVLDANIAWLKGPILELIDKMKPLKDGPGGFVVLGQEHLASEDDCRGLLNFFLDFKHDNNFGFWKENLGEEAYNRWRFDIIIKKIERLDSYSSTSFTEIPRQRS